MPQNDLVTAARFAESRVQNHGNELLGHVEDVVLDPMRGAITHVIVALAQAAPLRQARRVMVPWAALTPAYNDQLLTLEATAEQAAQFPEAPFDLTHRGLLTGAPEGQGASASFDL